MRVLAKHTETRQLEVLKYIYEQVELKGYPPTVREIGKAVDSSSASTVHEHLARPERKGLILRDPTKSRAIELIPEDLEKIGAQPATIPMLGVVTVGEPILAVEEASDFFPLPPDLCTEENILFMLTTRRESTINAGILDGDQVTIRKQLNTNNGDIVIVMTDEDEAIYERFFREVDHIRLQPENDVLAPIPLDNVIILGKVVGLYRNHI